MRFYGQAKGRRWDTVQPEPAPIQKGLKPCSKCGTWKPIDDFYKYKSKNGQLRARSVCIACTRERAREAYR